MMRHWDVARQHKVAEVDLYPLEWTLDGVRRGVVPFQKWGI